MSIPTLHEHSSHTLTGLTNVSPLRYCTLFISHMVQDGQQLPGLLAGCVHVTAGQDIIAMQRIRPIYVQKVRLPVLHTSDNRTNQPSRLFVYLLNKHF